MSDSLKDLNRRELFALMAVNILVYGIFIQYEQLGFDMRSEVMSNPNAIVLGIAGVAATGVLTGIIPSDSKAIVVFLRWRHPLPGCRAFSELARKDERISVSLLEETFGQLPCRPSQQNALWYRIFKTVDCDPAVKQAHKAYLLYRDYCMLSLLLIPFLGGLALAYSTSMKMAATYILMLTVQFVLTQRAAANEGNRLVTTVLAVAGSRER